MKNSYMFIRTFAGFHQMNLHLYKAVTKRFLREIEEGRDHFAMSSIIGDLRWDLGIGTTGKPFKIDSGCVSIYVRMLHFEYPQYDGFFRTKVMEPELSDELLKFLVEITAETDLLLGLKRGGGLWMPRITKEEYFKVTRRAMKEGPVIDTPDGFLEVAWKIFQKSPARKFSKKKMAKRYREMWPLFAPSFNSSSN